MDYIYIKKNSFKRVECLRLNIEIDNWISFDQNNHKI